MINKTIARRYAQAIFDMAREQSAIEKYAEDLKTIVNFIENNEDLKRFIYGRLVPVEAKKELMGKILTGEIHPMVANFINLVIDKSRENYFTGIVQVFDQLAAEEKRIVPAQVVSAIPLTDEQVTKLEEKLSQITGHSVKAEVTVEQSLIGGISVRIGDIVYDGSIVKQLSMLKEHLQQDTVGKIGVRQ